MNILCGTDLVFIKRLEKNIAEREDGKLPSFVTKCYTPKEIEYCMTPSNLAKRSERFAARFAVKEAVAKALGTGIMTMGIGFTDIETVNDGLGAPKVVLYGEALKRYESLGGVSIAISMSHDGEYASAYCTILTEGEDKK